MTIRATWEEGLRRKDEIHLDGIYSDSTTAKKRPTLGVNVRENPARGAKKPSSWRYNINRLFARIFMDDDVINIRLNVYIQYGILWSAHTRINSIWLTATALRKVPKQFWIQRSRTLKYKKCNAVRFSTTNKLWSYLSHNIWYLN